MKIAFIASEVAPFAKTGGLADVCGTLPGALEKLGHELIVIMPHYKSIDLSKHKVSTQDGVLTVTMGNNIKVYFIHEKKYFNRDGIYGDKAGDYEDNLERFSFFCHESLKLIKKMGFIPEIIHCHDWHTGLVPVLLKTQYYDDHFLKGVKSIFTIHNLAYQGIFPKEQYALMGVDGKLFSAQGFEFYDKINLMKAGILYSDYVTTVSPQYAREIQTMHFGCGLDGVLRSRRDHLAGILNGIDYDLFDPKKDPLIDNNYSARAPKLKERNKTSLQAMCGFKEDLTVPMFGFIGRLCYQKGLDLLLAALEDILHYRLQVVFVGVGDERYMTMLKDFVARYPEKVAVHFQFGEKMARQVYSGTDFFLMPSVYEPCGLGQMIALSYGSIPIVHHTGGLADTITPYNYRQESGNGFLFYHYTKEALVDVIEQALEVYKDTTQFKHLLSRAFKYRFSWEKSAEEYIRLYQKCLLSA